jgi:hypothetical protein
MGETTLARAPSFLGAEFNGFLFEQIGLDDRGRQVTVVSALARLDMDPWAEAERLSRLPDETAALSVAMVLSRLPEIAVGITGPQQTAMRLVQLLPKRLLRHPPKSLLQRAATLHGLPRAVAAGMFCSVIFLFLAQIFIQSHHAGLVPPHSSIAAQRVPVAPPEVGN